jgi:glycine cleavage system aminomethyltransferase T
VFFMQITAIRGSWLGVDGVEVFAGTGACKIAAGAIEKYHKREHIVPAGMECLEIALTEAAVPILLNGQPLPEILSPLSYGLGHHIDKNKVFLGKTGLDGLKPKRAMVGFATEDKAHTHKDLRLQYDGLEIGWTDRVVWSQKLGRTIGLAMIDAEMGDLREEVQVHGDGVTLGGEIVELPFENSISAGIY